MSSITYTTAGGSQSVSQVLVTQMMMITDAFYVENSGSTLLLEGVRVEQNRVQNTPWSVVAARSGSIVRVLETIIAENNAVEFGVVAFDSTVVVLDSLINGNVGTVRGDELYRRLAYTNTHTEYNFLSCPVPGG